jgi:hypothetical protein
VSKRRGIHHTVRTLPLTNALGALCLTMWSATCFVSLLNLPITDGWFTGLTFYTGIVGSIFGVKRWTYDPAKAQAASDLRQSEDSP